MDAFNPITTALILGATAALQKTAGQIVEDAYHGLKTLLINRFQATKAAVEVLESDPTDEDSQKVVNKQLLKANVAEDAGLLRQAQALIEAVQKHAPQLGRQLNVDLDDLTVLGNATLRSIGESVKGRRWDVGQDLTIENVGMGEKRDPNA